ncbi:pyridoxal phosphate-dependent aminotransferase [Acholeplasma laidlawii]|uniref:pyridoxal phosphate-dependent aminotransferase n=1 Tax=Acholeplasma laidlawii TaxID=2148 RepID=UPI002540734F|nr:histidinol-phosphate transaminase [Acholeplasma laidlawii]
MIDIKPDFKTLKPYSVVKQDVWHYNSKVKIKIDWNEEFLVNKKVEENLIDFIRSSKYALYPDVSSIDLNIALSKYHNINHNNIMTFNGSDEALDVICRSYIEKNNIVVFRNPEYGNFITFAETSLAKIEYFYDKDPFVLDENSFKMHIEKFKPRLVYISNPNNPTGVLYNFSFLKDMIVSNPNSLFIIDEAYIDFIEKTGYGESIDEMIHFSTKVNNVIVVRTFSKLYSLAGLRIGYIVTNNEIINDLSLLRKGKNVSMLSQIAAKTAIESKDFYNEKLEIIREQKKNVINKCSNLSYVDNCYDSSANFICLRINDKVFNRLKTYLYDNGVYIRDRSSIYQLDNIIRVSIIDDMSLFIHYMDEFEKLIKNI